MSIRLMAQVWDEAPVKGSQLNVLLVLADHANDEGVCWPSVPRIGSRSRISERQAHRVLGQLVDLGLIQVESRPPMPSVYTLTLTKCHPDIQGADPDIQGAYPDTAMSGEPSIEPSKEEEEPSLTRSQEVGATVDRCWAYWVETAGKKKQQLDDKRKRFIRNAVELAGEEAVKEALLGLSRSPWHNGDNPEHKTYLEVRYALKGIGDESDDERIEKARLWAQLYAPGFQTIADEAKVQRWLGDVQYTLSLPHRPERERAKQAYRKLKDAGFSVVQLDAPPWARLTR